MARAMLMPKMSQLRTSRTFDVLFVGSLLVLLGWGYINRIAVTDWLYFASYHPSSQIQTLATQAGLNDTGRRLLYRANPTLAGQSTIDQVCDQERLGCLTEKGDVYILDDPTDPEQTVVTAAHEMLHLAYRRLDAATKQRANALLIDALNRHPDPKLTDELADLPSQDEKLDEAHSILGTEYQSLDPALEAYYDTYFRDRTTVVAAEAASQTTTP